MVREIYENELKDLLELYLHLHESTISEMSEYLSKTWNCVFSTAGHAIDSEQRGQGLEIALPITVGDNVWIGTNVFVLPGVTIGNNTIIGAGSVVNKNIPDGVIPLLLLNLSDYFRKPHFQKSRSDFPLPSSIRPVPPHAYREVKTSRRPQTPLQPRSRFCA